MSDVFKTDENGKLLVCTERVFRRRGEADLQCVRPQHHDGPHAYPVDQVHAHHLKEIARLDGVIAGLKRELAEVRAHASALRSTLQDAREDLIWCSASDDFAPGGKGRAGWVKGPAKTIEAATKVLAGEPTKPALAHGMPCPVCGEEIP